MRRTLQDSIDAYNKAYMAQPAALTDSEKQAREIKNGDPQKYQDYIGSDQYIQDNWSRWLELAKSGPKLTDDEKREVNDAILALSAAIDRMGVFGPVPDNLGVALGESAPVLTEDQKITYQKYQMLAGALASRESTAYAAGVGGATFVPGAKQITDAVKDSFLKKLGNSDPEFVEAMLHTDPIANAKQAHPGAFTAGNLVVNAALLTGRQRRFKGSWNRVPAIKRRCSFRSLRRSALRFQTRLVEAVGSCRLYSTRYRCQCFVWRCGRQGYGRALQSNFR